MNRTVYEKGIEKGRHAERVDLLYSLIEDRFGTISEALRNHLEQLSLDELRRLAHRMGTVNSLTELGLPVAAP